MSSVFPNDQRTQEAGIPLPPTEPVQNSRLAFTILATVQATLIFTIALIMVPLPKIADEFAVGPAALLLLQVSYGLPFSGLLLFGGRLADRYRGRRVFMVGLGMFGAASVMAALAPSFGMLVGMRALEGVGGALTAPAAIAVLRKLFPEPAKFGTAMATWGGVSVLGAVLGFVVSGVLTNWVSWRWMFAVPVLVALLGLAVARGLLPNCRDDVVAKRPGMDPLGALFATPGIALASFGLIASGEHAWTSIAVYGPLAAGLMLLAAFLLVERQARDPLLPLGFLLDSCRLAGLLGMFLAAAGSVLIEFVLLLFFQQLRGWTPLFTALAFLPFAIALIVANYAAPSRVARYGAINTLIAGFVVAAIGLGWLAGISHDISYNLGLVPGMVLLAIGISLVFSGAAVLSMTNVPRHQAGLAGGVMNTGMELGPTVGLTALMSVAAFRTDVVEGYAWAFGTAAATFALAAILALLLAKRPAADDVKGCQPVQVQ